MESVLQVHNLDVWYKDIYALKDVSAQIPENRITSLIGASGSGKSTFLRALNRMLDTVPHARLEGSILFEDRNILHNDTDVIQLRRSIGMVFQNPTPFPKSIFDNVAYGLEIQGIRNKQKGGFLQMLKRRSSPENLEESTNELEQAVVRSLKEAALWEEVKHRLHESAFRLSGGQQQRLCIARAIAVRPSVLLLDEPCSALDPISTHKIEELLTQLKQHYTIVIVTHNLHQAKRISDYVGFFHLGELIEFGPTQEIYSNARQNLTREYVRGDFG